MAVTDDGYLYGVNTLKFNNAALGLIDEESIDWGGTTPETVEIWAAQQRSAPVKIIQKNQGKNELKFNLIQLKAANMVAVMGGKTNAKGGYDAPRASVTLEGPVEITTADGSTIKIPKASLVSAMKGKLGYSDVLKVECTLTVMLPDDAEAAPYNIDPPAAV